MKTIKRISPGSAFRVGAAAGALMIAFFGFFVILLPALFGASMLDESLDMSLGLIGGIFAYAAAIVLYAIFGGIGSAIYAFFYNIVAGWVGGIEVDIS